MDDDARWPYKIGSPNGWPLSDGSKMWSGLDVLTGLVAAVNDLTQFNDPTWRRGDRDWRAPVVIGCSPWLTDGDLVDALTQVHSCIVTTKPYKRPDHEMMRLHENGKPVWKGWLRGLDSYGLPGPDGGRPLEWPGTTYSEDSAHDLDLGPVRVAGWRRPPSAARAFPIVHAKVAVLGYQQAGWYDTGYGEAEFFGFNATAAWIGSANFTRQSRVSAEIGVLTTDQSLITAAESFVCDVLRVSEPLSDIAAVDPTPELVEAYQWEPSSSDLAYMREQDAEYMEREYGPDWDER